MSTYHDSLRKPYSYDFLNGDLLCRIKDLVKRTSAVSLVLVASLGLLGQTTTDQTGQVNTPHRACASPPPPPKGRFAFYGVDSQISVPFSLFACIPGDSKEVFIMDFVSVSAQFVMPVPTEEPLFYLNFMTEGASGEQYLIGHQLQTPSSTGRSEFVVSQSMAIAIDTNSDVELLIGKLSAADVGHVYFRISGHYEPK